MQTIGNNEATIRTICQIKYAGEGKITGEWDRENWNRKNLKIENQHFDGKINFVKNRKR